MSAESYTWHFKRFGLINVKPPFPYGTIFEVAPIGWRAAPWSYIISLPNKTPSISNYNKTKHCVLCQLFETIHTTYTFRSLSICFMHPQIRIMASSYPPLVLYNSLDTHNLVWLNLRYLDDQPRAITMLGINLISWKS